jgi:hypothetical protein
LAAAFTAAACACGLGRRLLGRRGRHGGRHLDGNTHGFHPTAKRDRSCGPLSCGSLGGCLCLCVRRATILGMTSAWSARARVRFPIFWRRGAIRVRKPCRLEPAPARCTVRVANRGHRPVSYGGGEGFGARVCVVVGRAPLRGGAAHAVYGTCMGAYSKFRGRHIPRKLAQKVSRLDLGPAEENLVLLACRSATWYGVLSGTEAEQLARGETGLHTISRDQI